MDRQTTDNQTDSPRHTVFVLFRSGLQSFTATKHTGSEGTRDMLSKNKKGRVISLFLAYDRGSNPRPRAYKPVFVPLDYYKLSLSRFIEV